MKVHFPVCCQQIRRLLPILWFAILSLSCTDFGTAPDFLADHSSIADPMKRWEAYAVEDYTILQRHICYCADRANVLLITVRSGKIVSIVNPTDSSAFPANRRTEYKTIPDLFTLTRSIDTAAVYNFQVAYDPRYGYPTYVWVDPSHLVADEEYGYETELIH